MHQDAVAPSPVFLALVIDLEIYLLLGNLGDSNDDVLCFSAIFLGFICEEESGSCDVLEGNSASAIAFETV